MAEGSSAARFCERCSAELGGGARFCAQCGAPVGTAPPQDEVVHPSAAATESLGPAQAAGVEPSGSDSSRVHRGPWIVGAALAVLLVAGGSAFALGAFDHGASAPTTTTMTEAGITEATTSPAQRPQVEAIGALPAFAAGWKTFLDTVNGAVQVQSDALKRNDLAAYRSAVQTRADAVQAFIGSISAINFPPSMEADVRALLDALSNEHAAELDLAAAAEPQPDAANQAAAAVNTAEQIVARDLQSLTNFVAPTS